MKKFKKPSKRNLKKFKLRAYRYPYNETFFNDKGVPIINNRIGCLEKENIELHQHYSDAYDYALQYWVDYWQKSPWYANPNDLLEGSLQHHPSRKKDKKSGKKMQSFGVRRFTHHKDFRDDGKYYTHVHMFTMMKNKIYSKLPGFKYTLADWNEGQYMRWNCYVKWIQDFDTHFNNGLKVKDLEECKVKIQWH